MKTVTVRLPEAIAADIEAESRRTGMSKSDVVRRRLERGAPRGGTGAMTFHELAADLIGAVDDRALPRDLSAKRKAYLTKGGYGKNRPR